MTSKGLRELRLTKQELQKGAYYIGICRNARIARWDGEQFWHWRLKFGQLFLESIHHIDDDNTFDVFDALSQIYPTEAVREIPLKGGDIVPSSKLCKECGKPGPSDASDSIYESCAGFRAFIERGGTLD